MSVDNAIYDRDAAQWWSDESHLALLHCLNPARVRYLLEVLRPGCTLLDIGCGGGLLSEVLAAQGFRVCGIDPSAGSIEAARRHADETGLDIAYHVGTGERLPFDGESFDAVCCCDVLEHVDDLDEVVGEAARVLRPGGVFVYDTINRTWLSWLLMVKLVQDWLEVAPKGLHAWEKFIKPGELAAKLERHGVQSRRVVGLSPPLDPLSSIRRLGAFRKLRRGELSYGDLADEIVFETSRLKSMSYMGHAVKSGVSSQIAPANRSE